MPNFSATLLMTRPADASEQFFRSLPKDVQSRLHLIISPLLHISPTGADVLLDDVAGIIFTSARALPFATGVRPIPVFCVGEATRREAEQAGWQVRVSAPTADALIQALTEAKPTAPLLHIAGRHRRGDIAGRLSAQGIEAHEVVVYEQNVMPFTQDAKMALDGSSPVIVPLFSPRTAAAFAAQHRGSAPLSLVAISAAALQPTQDVPAEYASSADTPTADAVRTEVLVALRRVEAADTPL